MSLQTRVFVAVDWIKFVLEKILYDVIEYLFRFFFFNTISRIRDATSNQYYIWKENDVSYEVSPADAVW